MDNHEYTKLYYNSRPLESSSEEDESSEEEENEQLQLNKKINYGKNTFNFLIDSADRDWTDLATETFNFQVKFGNSSDSNEIIKTLSIENNQYKISEETKRFLGSKTLSFPINVRNIESISVHTLIMPKRLMYLGGANYMDILDFRYLLVCIEEISNVYYGTNSDINKAIAVMYPLSVIYKSGNEPKHIEFKDKGHLIKEFKPVPINCFNSLKFVIKDPNGKVLKFKNDVISIKQVDIHASNEFITITTNESINDEYKNGDLIKIKNFNTSDSIDSRFITFINREDGHKIYKETAFVDTTYNSTSNLVNSFVIIAPGSYNSSNPSKFVRDSYLPTTTTLDSDITGKILNTNLQFSLFLKVDTKIVEFNNLNSQII